MYLMYFVYLKYILLLYNGGIKILKLGFDFLVLFCKLSDGKFINIFSFSIFY